MLPHFEITDHVLSDMCEELEDNCISLRELQLLLNVTLIEPTPNTKDELRSFKQEALQTFLHQHTLEDYFCRLFGKRSRDTYKNSQVFKKIRDQVYQRTRTTEAISKANGLCIGDTEYTDKDRNWYPQGKERIRNGEMNTNIRMLAAVVSRAASPMDEHLASVLKKLNIPPAPQYLSPRSIINKGLSSTLKLLVDNGLRLHKRDTHYSRYICIQEVGQQTAPIFEMTDKTTALFTSSGLCIDEPIENWTN